MHPLKSTWNGSATERTTNAGGAAATEAAWRPTPGNTASATAASGETCRKHHGRRWERRRDGKRADADTCESLSSFPLKSSTKRWWTSWRLLKSGNSHPNDWLYDGGAEAGSGAGGGRNGGLYPFVYVPFLVSSCVQFIVAFAFVLSLNFHIYQWGWRVVGGELCYLAGSPGGGGDIGSCHTLIRVHTVWIKQKDKTIGILLRHTTSILNDLGHS